MSRRRLALSVAVVLLGASSVAVGSLSGPFFLDDLPKIVENQDLREWRNLSSRLLHRYERGRWAEQNDPSRPLVYGIYTVLYQLDGPNPVVFRAFNLLIHAACSVLVLVLARRLLATQAHREPAALFTALLFALSPIQIGTAIYVYALSDLLSTMFVLGSVVAWLFVDTQGRPRLLASLVCMALALACKQSVVATVLFVAGADWALSPESRFASWLAALKGWWSFASHGVLALLYLVGRLFHFGAVGDLEARSDRVASLDYASSQPRVILEYLALAFWPAGLSAHHEPEPYSLATKLVSMLLVVSLLFGVVALLRSTDLGWRVAGFGGLWFFGALAPTSSFIPTTDLFVERRVYFAAFGLFLFAAVALSRLADRLSAARLERGFAGALALYLAGLVVVGHQRKAVFQSAVSLWSDVVARYPRHSFAWNNLGVARLERQEHQQAQDCFTRAVDLNPLNSSAHLNLGGMHLYGTAPGGSQTALGFFEQAIAADPSSWQAIGLAGVAHHHLGQLEAAEARFRQALSINPDAFVALRGLGLLALHAGQLGEARALLLRASEVDPTSDAKDFLAQIR